MRDVKHVGARTLTASGGLDPKVLVAAPVLRGERLVYSDFEFYGATQADEPPEQPSLVDMFVGYLPGVVLQGIAVTTATLEALTKQVLFGRDAAANPRTYGGEPNPGADESQWSEEAWRVVSGARFLWRRQRLTSVEGIHASFTLVSGSGTSTGEGKQSFRGFAKIKTGPFQSNGVIVAGIAQPLYAAQTDFGVAEMDDQIEVEEIYEALHGGNVTADSDAAKLQELLFGGDTYVEADTLKDWVGRAYCVAKIGFAGGVTARVQGMRR